VLVNKACGRVALAGAHLEELGAAVDEEVGAVRGDPADRVEVRDLNVGRGEEKVQARPRRGEVMGGLVLREREQLGKGGGRGGGLGNFLCLFVL
jgi:hypothetical protein